MSKRFTDYEKFTKDDSIKEKKKPRKFKDDDNRSNKKLKK